MIAGGTVGESLTLTETELAACRPMRGEGGRALRAFCPFHSSDHQRSLRVKVDTGHFTCFACGSWGYTEEARRRWREERHREADEWKSKEIGMRKSGGMGKKKPLPSRPERSADRAGTRSPKPKAQPPAANSERPIPRSDLPELLCVYREALPGSLGEASYLRQRGIPLEIAKAASGGYAAPGTWPHRVRDWKWGRLVFPHTTPDGRLVNLYGRAVGAAEKVPKGKRHDHLPGDKGYFNATALREGEGPLFMCEGAFDALSLMAAGYPRVVAIFGVNGWRWEWARGVREIVLALDTDPAGQQSRCALVRQAVLRGKQVAFLPPEAYGGHKDLNEAWMADALRVGEWPAAAAVDVEGSAALEALQNLWEERAAILEFDADVSRTEAERLAQE